MKCYPKSGAANPKWRGGLIVVDGYVYKYKPDHPNATKDGYVCQHRLVMETIIGRYLLPSETVHHLDQNRTNNLPENLLLCSSNGRHTIDCHDPSRSEKGQFVSGNTGGKGRLLTYNGLTLNLKEWAKRLGVSLSLISHRFRQGKTVEQILVPRIRRKSR